MIQLVYTYEVPAELQEEYLKVTREKIKPVWETRGCLSYDVWQASDNDDVSFIKTMTFENRESMQKSLALLQTDTEAQAAVALWSRYALAFGSGTSIKATRRIYEKKA